MNLQKLRTEVICAAVIGLVVCALFGWIGIALAQVFHLNIAREDIYATCFLGGVLISFYTGE
jgi:hypothetical protein